MINATVLDLAHDIFNRASNSKTCPERVSKSRAWSVTY